jgi:hypothetical protein
MSDETTEEMPWKLPVSAAILGAFLAAIYVIFTIVNAPAEDVDTLPAGIAVESSAFPSGYISVGSDVAMRGDVLWWSSRGITVFISSVVRGGLDPVGVAPVEVAVWTLTSAGGEALMKRQSTAVATPGSFTVDFGPIPGAESATLTATLTATGESVEIPIESVVGP